MQFLHIIFQLWEIDKFLLFKIHAINFYSYFYTVKDGN